jgi:2-C-methyl-D-erythritol 4-phosphate cytidylyltransferase
VPDGDETPALGTAVETGRGSLPFALIHGEALVACAAWALGEAGVTTVDLGTEWAGIVDSGEPFVLHDALCPMTPAVFLAECVARAVETGRVVVGVRPVTDTVKTVDGGFVGGTLDREELRSVVSPIVLPPAVVAAIPGLPTLDFAALVEWLRGAHEVDLVEAPAAARRVGSEDDVRLLEALTSPA